jgi:hypothetical protein
MTQQEIKANLPPLPYYVSHVLNGEIVSVRDNMSNIVCEVEEQKDNDIDEAICRGIVHAINNTYDKGINPESVPDMYNALQVVHQYLTNIGSYETAMNIQHILKNATL